MLRRTYKTGVTLIEVVIGVTIVSTMLVAIGFAINTYVEARATLLDNMKSAYLAEEGYEFLRALRDDNWNNIDSLTPGTTYYFALSSTTLATTNTPEIINTNWRRSFVIQNGYRNASDDIVSSTTVGSSIDDGTKEIYVSVSGPNGTSTMRGILTNLYVQ